MSLAAPISADTVTALRTIPSQSVITEQDVEVIADSVPGGLRDLAAVIGAETKYVIYAGHPIRAEDIGPPALVERNQLVTLVFVTGGLYISTEGRALNRAASGDYIRAMNIGSKQIVSGQVLSGGRVLVQGSGHGGDTK